MVSDAHWPSRSMVSVELIDTNMGSVAITRGSLT